MEGTVRGRTVRLDAALVREAFLLPVASLEIKRQVWHSLKSNWFPEYERSGKRYIVRTCWHREWAAALECISMMILASRRPRTIPGRLVYYIKNFKLDPEDEPEERLDFADLKAHSLRREVFAVQAYLQADKPERYLETFVAIPLTHILSHLQLLTGRECDAPPAAPAAPADPSEAMPAYYLEPTIEEGPHDLPRGDGYEALLPRILVGPSVVHPRNNLDKHVKLKGFHRLHDHGICLRERSTDRRLVRAHRRHMDGIVEPILVLRDFWGETPLPIDRFIIWSDVSSATRDLLLTEWPHFFEHAERTVEEAPAEEATPVEEVAAEETTRVEEVPTSVPTPMDGASAEEATRVGEATRVEEAPPVEEIPLAIPIPVEAIPLGATQE
ncbi:hypothetical protein R1sor_005326 [Riccia sorocarpa]|uniref:Uncharacterized protein n=1 Tax=Riccia sorocarpa TaxID=122646 RepID=A0ABD3HN17_9MARC